jgi:hypothetical protein
MRWVTDKQCQGCGDFLVVYPVSTKMSKINERTLPGWTRCECKPKFQEITTFEMESLVPGWKRIINPKGDEANEEETEPVSGT